MRPPLSKQGPTSPAPNGNSVLLSAGRDIDQVVGHDSAQFRSGAATTRTRQPVWRRAHRMTARRRAATTSDDLHSERGLRTFRAEYVRFLPRWMKGPDFSTDRP